MGMEWAGAKFTLFWGHQSIAEFSLFYYMSKQPCRIK